MTDTPQHIREIQLKTWLSKTPGERLLQALKNNQDCFLFAKHGREAMQKLNNQKQKDVFTTTQ
jgi:hypothetical protein